MSNTRSKGELGFQRHIIDSLCADARWRDAARAAFARAIDVEGADGAPGRLALTVMPQWVKVRWRAGELQAAKLYHSAGATLLSPRS